MSRHFKLKFFKIKKHNLCEFGWETFNGVKLVLIGFKKKNFDPNWTEVVNIYKILFLCYISIHLK